LLVQFSFKSAAETSECKGQVANSQWQRVPDRRAGSGEAAWSMYPLSQYTSDAIMLLFHAV